MMGTSSSSIVKASDWLTDLLSLAAKPKEAMEIVRQLKDAAEANAKAEASAVAKIAEAERLMKEAQALMAAALALQAELAPQQAAVQEFKKYLDEVTAERNKT